MLLLTTEKNGRFKLQLFKPADQNDVTSNSISKTIYRADSQGV